MAWARRQGVLGTQQSGFTVSAAFTSAVTTGSLVTVVLADAFGSTASPPTVTDDKSNTYSAGPSIPDGPNGVTLYSFYLPNITNGPSTVHATYGVTGSFLRMGIEEWSGGATSAILDGTNAHLNSSATTVANNVTSGIATVTQGGELIWGTANNSGGNGITAVPGTNYTAGLQAATGGVQTIITEYLIEGAGANTSSTFTPGNAGDNWLALVMTFKSAASGVQSPFAAWDYGIYDPPKDIRDYRDWIQQDRLLNLLKGQDKVLVGYQEWVRLPSLLNPEPYAYRSIEVSYNKNLVGKDKLPTGAIEWIKDLSTLRPEPYPYRHWDFKYNPNLVGKDRTRPLQFNSDFGTYDPPRAAYEAYSYRYWEWAYNRELLGKDKLPTLNRDFPNPTPVYWYNHWQQRFQLTPPVTANPFFQTDWPLPTQVQWYQDWASRFLLELLGQDQLPNRQQDWPNPYPVQWYQYWSQSPSVPTVIVINPFFQLDWPNPRDPREYREWQWKYIPNLIGQDTLPSNQKDWPNPYPVQWYQSLERDFGPGGRLAPFSQKDWPNPTPITWDQFWAVAYNRYLLPGKDQFPNRQSDWPNPQTPVWRIGQETNLLENPFQVGVAFKPFAQLDWPLPYPVTWYQQWAWKYVQELIGKDSLPHNQSDWPTPYPVVWDRYYSQSLEPLTLRGRDTLPVRQQDWPVPALAVPIPIDEFEGYFNINLYPPAASVITYILMPQILL